MQEPVTPIKLDLDRPFSAKTDGDQSPKLVNSAFLGQDMVSYMKSNHDKDKDTEKQTKIKLREDSDCLETNKSMANQDCDKSLKSQWSSMDMKLLICQHCGECFQDKDSLNDHQTKGVCLFNKQSTIQTHPSKQKTYSRVCGKNAKLIKMDKKPTVCSVAIPTPTSSFCAKPTPTSASSPNRQRLRCSHCLKFFHNEIALKAHIEEHKLPKGDCSFNKQSTNQTHPSIQKTYSQVCGKNVKLMKVDQKPTVCSVAKPTPTSAFSQNGQRFRCSHCSKFFNDEIAWNAHIEAHKLPIKCQLCNETLHELKLLVGHYFSYHSKEAGGRIKCKSCDEVFQLTALQRHYEWHFVDSEKPDYKCEFCNITCQDKTSLTLHMRLHGDKKLPSPPKPCVRSFETLKRKNTPEIIKIANVFKCPKCPFNSPSELATNDHIFWAHNDSHHECYFCDLNFSNRVQMLKHERTHIQPFYCPECQRTYSSKEKLEIHTVHAHSEDLPWACQYCKKRFSNQKLRDGHELTHLGFSAYKCRICGIPFTQEHNQKRHEKTYHPEYYQREIQKFE